MRTATGRDPLAFITTAVPLPLLAARSGSAGPAAWPTRAAGHYPCMSVVLLATA